jgi:glutamate dehydrogenase (NADP+)
MTELWRHIGDRTDVPAGDIGVGGREIGYLFGQYKRLANEFSGVLTGKGIAWGGSLIRPEATGYGCVYFAEEMLKTRGDSVKAKTCLVSGSGNVAQYCVQKITQLGGKVITMSDSDGFIVDEAGIDGEKLAYVMELKNVKRGRISEYVEKYPSAQFHSREGGKSEWLTAGAQCAFPCATQNEIDEVEAQALLDNGVYCVSEGANMPTTESGVHKFLQAGILYGPGKAANAGGVSTSGLEMSQNAAHTSWPAHEVDAKLHGIMVNIHENARRTAEEYGTPGNYVNGANIAGFLKVARAMLEQGVV